MKRRDFMQKTAAASIGLAWGLSAKSYSQILGANDRINFAVAGINSRGNALAKAIKSVNNTTIGYICDVDSRALEKGIALVKTIGAGSAQGIKDIRKLLEKKDLDAIAIATPDHWHAPMALLAIQAGKNVYVEKPCSHNPREGELLVEAQNKFPKLFIQMGNQQRSAPTSIQAIEDIKKGIIGNAYFAKAWYSNNRGSIGKGKKIEIPDWLDWELWQGPAPRKEYKDNLVHYNWHWFWHWGTGEINNNGTHEIDICRWALGVDYPTKVNSAGGRFHFQDDWEFCDTQSVNYEFAGGKMITWESKSCNSFNYFDRGRGVTIHGTEGTILLDRNDYLVYDQKGKLVKEMKEEGKSATTDAKGEGVLDEKHFLNFANAIRKGEKLHSPIDEGHKSNLLCHLGNIAQKVGRTLETDTTTGKLINDKEAMQWWSREYEKGWDMKV